jgi:hypothetical protein
MPLPEHEWLSHREYPDSMLYDELPIPVSERKGRLLAAAFCRRVWHLLSDERARRAVEVAELYADGKATPAELQAACTAAEETTAFDGDTVIWCEVGGAAFVTVEPEPSPLDAAYIAAENVGWEAARSADEDTDEPDAKAMAAERAAQCDLVREVFGNPFRPVVLNPAWLTPTVVSLAQAADNDRVMPSGHLALARLAILADALEEAGCTEHTVLEHLRTPGPHVSGCWPIDLLLAKE